MRRLLFLALSFLISNVISTTFDSQIEALSGTIDCNATTNCSIYCRSASSCDSLTINATLTTNLDIKCEAGYSCKTMTIYGNHISVDCDYTNSCSDSIITISSTNIPGDFVLNCDDNFPFYNPENTDNGPCLGLTLYAAVFMARYTPLCL